MSRRPRSVLAHHVYHIVNRGALKQQLFATDGDYAEFLGILKRGLSRAAIEVYAYCLMPNHWHLIVRPGSAAALSTYMGWATTMHAMRFRRMSDSRGQGHVYQGRFVSVPILDERQMATTLVYVEANPLRAQLVSRAEQWRWSSLTERASPQRRSRLIVDGPWTLPWNWVDIVNVLGQQTARLD